jgi:aryl-alcohol dehydrogenase-like predicted oxidoreductase
MKLGLGTVQFGLDYGVTNKTGKPPTAEIEAIIQLARESRIELLDTAAGYGNSEEILGNQLKPHDSFRVITKTPDWRGNIPADAAAAVSDSMYRSLRRLNRPSVYGLLIHRADDLLTEHGSEIWRAMEKLRARGQVSRIGVSIYTGSEIDRVLQRHRPDIVQMPVSALDQRLVRSGHIDELRRLGIEIHARSILLQGVLVSAESGFPEYLEELKTPLLQFQEFSRAHDMTPLEGALSFVNSLSVDAALFGVTSVQQTSEVITAMRRAKTSRVIAWPEFVDRRIDLVDPRNWPSVSRA